MMLSPVIVKEFRTMMRSRPAFWFLFALLAVTGSIFAFAWGVNAGAEALASRAFFSRTMFLVFSSAQYCALGLIAPVLAAAVVTVERENRTLDLLLCTGVSRFNILLSKWLSTIAYQVLLVVCMGPILSLTLQLGGVGSDEYLNAGLIIALAVLAYGMAGLACSCWFRRSAPATFCALGIVLGLAAVWPAAWGIASDLFRVRMFGDPIRPRGLGSVIWAVSPATAAVGYINRALGAGGGGKLNLWADPLLRNHLYIQAILFLASAWIAWRGLTRKEALQPTVAHAVIDDPAKLDARRKSFPFYLIDPLKRAQEIRDGQNPVYVKEQRVGSMSKTHVLIRLSYLGLFFSVLLLPIALDSRSYESMENVALVALAFMILFVPLAGSTALSREREEDTMDLLRATTLTPFQIVSAKWLATVRFLAFIGASVAALPVFIHVLVGMLRNWGVFSFNFEPWDMPKVLPPAVAYASLFAAIALYWSAACRKNVTAIVLTYGVVLLLVVGPPILHQVWGSLHYMARSQGNDPFGFSKFLKTSLGSYLLAAFGLLARAVGPVLSPILHLSNSELSEYRRAPKLWFARRDEWGTIAIHFALVGMLAGFVFWRAVRRFEKSFKK